MAIMFVVVYRSKSAEGQDDITARHVFTDVSIKLAIQKVGVVKAGVVNRWIM